MSNWLGIPSQCILEAHDADAFAAQELGLAESSCCAVFHPNCHQSCGVNPPTPPPWSCEAADLLEPPKPRKIRSSSKWLKSDFRGLPKSKPKSNPKSDLLDPKKSLKSDFFGSTKSLLGLLLGLLLGRPLFCHFLVTYELLLIFRGFGGSRRSAGSFTTLELATLTPCS